MSFFVSSRRRHTRCALVTGVQTWALPISVDGRPHALADEGGDVAREQHAEPVLLDLPAHHVERGRPGVLAMRAETPAAGGGTVRAVARHAGSQDRKRAVAGQKLSVRVVLGGRRTIKKNKQKKKRYE